MDAERNETETGEGPGDPQPEEGRAPAPAAGSAAARAPRRRGAWATVLGWLALTMNVSAGGLLVWRVRRFAPDNRWDIETRLFWLPAGATLLWGLMELVWWRRRGWVLPVLVVLTALGLAALVCVFDYYNVLLSHQRWIDRGLPLPWQH